MQDSPRYDWTSEDIAFILPDGNKLLVVYQKPVLLKKLKEGVCTQSDVSGSKSLFLGREGSIVELSNQDQFDQYLALQDHPYIYTNKYS